MLLSSSVLIAHVAALAACSSSTPTAPERPPPQEAQPSISDAAHGGTAHFYFLPPLVAAPEFEGTFDPTHSPTVEICTLGTAGCEPVIAEFTRQTGPGSETVRVDTAAEHYIANWHTKDFALEDGQIYRIRVLLEGQEAGHADVVAVSSGKELKNASTGDVIALKDGRTLPIKFRIEEGLVVSDGSLAFPPDSLPDRYYADVVQDPVCSAIPFVRHIIWVNFKEGTTQEQRRAAVDSVNGMVVGGLPTSEQGLYAIYVDDDERGTGVCAAEDALESLPYVELAAKDGIASPGYRRPNDGPGWRDWDVDPSSVDGTRDNWAQEAIAAPLAWGCNTGSDSVPIAVVDHGFHVAGNSDLAPNVNLGLSPGIGTFAGSSHGTAVASILAAAGDNDSLMTGVMWEADLRLTRIDTAASSAIGAAVARAIAQQPPPRIVNLSWAINWPPTHVPQDTSAADVNDRIDFYRLFRGGLGTINLADLPLIVIAAGNDGIDAKWAAYPLLSQEFPNRVMVVGGTTAADQIWGGSNTGSLVDIYAPADEVSGIVKVGPKTFSVHDSLDGTSFAAPLVAGTAGLLASFDRNLTVPQIWDYILEGTDVPNGVPILNAYAALRLAAEETGAPLCSNRVWAAGGQLFALRGATPHALAPTMGEAIAQVEVLHGGKFLRYLSLQNGQPVIEALKWEAGDWNAAGTQPSKFTELRAGTLASVFGRSHDQDTAGVPDTLAFIDASAVFETRWYVTEDTRQAQVFIRPRGDAAKQVGAITVKDLPGALEETCIERDPDDHFCFLTIIETRAWFFRLSYPQFPGSSPDERLGFTTVSPIQVVRDSLTAWTPCGIDPTHECRELHVVQEHRSAIVSTIDLTGSGAAPVFADSLKDEMVFWIGQGERGEDLVLGRGRWDITFRAHADTFHVTGSPFFGLVQNVDTCAIEYREQATFASSVSIPTEDPCQFGFFDGPSPGSGGGTIAPSVGVAGGPSLSVTSSAVEGAVTISLPIIEPTPSGPVVLTP